MLAETGISGNAYLAELREHAGRVMAHGQVAGYPGSLAAAIQIAVDRVAAEDRAAVRLLHVCAMLAPEPVPLDLLLTAASARRLPKPLRTAASNAWGWGGCVARLGRYGLVKPGPDGPVLHRLTQAITADQLDPDIRAQTRTLAEYLLTAARPADARDPVGWSVWARLLPHLLVLDPASTANPQLRDMAQQATKYLLDRGDLTAGHTLAKQLHQAWQHRLGDDHPDTLSAAHNLVYAYSLRGDFHRAHQLAEDTLTRCRRVLGDDHLQTLRSASNLAGDLRELGRVDEALALDQDTLTRCRRVLSDDHPDTLNSVNNLAECLRLLGRVDEALALDQDTLTRRRRILGDDHPFTLNSADHLAADLRLLGRVDEALALDQDTLTRRRRVLSDDHPDTLTSASNLAADLRRLGRADEAETLDAYARKQRRPDEPKLGSTP